MAAGNLFVATGCETDLMISLTGKGESQTWRPPLILLNLSGAKPQQSMSSKCKKRTGGERKCSKSQDKEEEGATDGVCLSMLSRTAAVNWLLAEADLLLRLHKGRIPAARLPGRAHAFGAALKTS